MNIKKALIYVVLAILSLIAGIYSPSLFFDAKDSGFLKTSMYEILNGALVGANKIIDDAIITDADLSLEKVVLRKDGDQYETILKIKNTGSYVKNLQVVFANDLSKDFILLKNTDTGLSLNKDEEFVSRDYKFFMDEKFSGADINFYVKVLNDGVFEANTANNYFKVERNDFRSTVDDFFVSNVDKNGGIEFDFKVNDFLISDKSFEIYISDRLSFNPIDEKYREAYVDGKIYPYSEIPLTKATFESGNFKSIVPQNGFPVKIQVFENAFKNTDKTFYLMLKVNYDTESASRFKLSNILKVSPIETVSLEDFAQLISDASGQGADLSSMTNDPVKRGETVKYVFEYFEVDTDALKSKKVFFKDIKPGSEYYDFAQALKTFKFSKGFSEYFAAEEPINKQLLYLLLNESV